MKKILYIAVICLFASFAIAADTSYYVTQSGAGNQDGSAIAHAWSAADFNTASNWSATDNAAKIDPGDTVYLSKTITTGLEPLQSGTSGNVITIDGYETNDTKYKLTGNGDDSESSGRAVINTSDGNEGIYLNSIDYITIQDIEFTNTKQAIYIQNANDIDVFRNYIHDIPEEDGLQINYDSYNITIGGSLGNGNVFKNIGDDTADADIVTQGGSGAILDPHDIIISYNHIYADSSTRGIDGITLNWGYDILIEYNSIHSHKDTTGDDPIYKGDALGENGIDIKKAAYNIVIRYNKIYDHIYQSNIILNGLNNTYAADQVYIYGNLIHTITSSHNIEFQQVSGESYDDIYVFSNIIYDAGSSGIILARGYYHIFNNTLAENANNTTNAARTNITVLAAYDAQVKNNIFIKGRPTKDDECQFWVGDYYDDDTTADYNFYFWPSETSKIHWGNASYLSVAQLADTEIEDDGRPQEENGADDDPELTDWANNDYTINDSTSPVIGAGVAMGSGNIATLTIHDYSGDGGGGNVNVLWGAALGPETDWSDTLPSIDKVNRDDVGWDVGAYALAGPVRSAIFPTTQQTCNGDPTTVASGLTTAANATCKYDSTDQAYATMGNTFTGGGGASHTANISQACDGSTIYYIRCSDTSSSVVNASSVTMTVDVAAAAGV